MSHAVAVTGLGAITALGRAEQTFARVVAGEVAVRVAGDGEAPVARCELPGTFAELPRTEALSLTAMTDALRDAGLEAYLTPGAALPPLGLVWGTTTGGLYELEPLLASVTGETPGAELTALLGFPISRVVTRARQRLFGLGPTRTVCSACSSGALAVAVGASFIRSGRASRVLVGGADALCRTTLLGFGALGLLDPEGGRPFARSRAGLSLGEGAGALVLESLESATLRGARVRAHLRGYDVGSEAHHVTQPDPTGSRAAALIRGALADAELQPEAVGYVNAHGTGTRHNDAAEQTALKAVFGATSASPRVASNKGHIGHLLGGSGAVEAALTVRALEAGLLPPNVAAELEPWGALMGAAPERAQVEAALSNSFGFGGMGAVLCFARAAGERRPREASLPVFLARSVLAGPLEGPLKALTTSGEMPHRSALLDVARSRRFDALSSWIAWLASELLPGGGDEETALVHGTAFGLIEQAAQFLRKAAAARPSPADFPNLLPSAASGNAALYGVIRGPVLAVSAGGASAQLAAHQALEWVQAGRVRRALSCVADPLDPLALRVAAASWDSAPSEWGAAGQLWCHEPQPIQVTAFGEGLALPRAPGGAARALIATDDGSLAWDANGWEAERLRLPSLEGLGGGAFERAAARLLSGELRHALVVDVYEGRLLHTQLTRVSSSHEPGVRAPGSA